MSNVKISAATMFKKIKNCPSQFLAQLVLDPQTGKSLEYHNLIKHPNKILRDIWALATCKELEQLAQRYKSYGEATNCIEFIKVTQIPTNKKNAYTYIVAKI